ncbi:MAG: mechanosensitive ion channel [Bacteroidota bacterium]
MNYLNDLYASLSATIGSAFANILGALAFLFIGLLLARLLRNVARRLLSKTNIDEQLGQKLKLNFRVDNFVAKIVYYLVVVYTLLIVLGMMGLDSVLTPIENMLGQFLSFLPNLIGAGIIGFAGYIIAKIIAEATGLLSNSLSPIALKAGFKNPDTVSSLLKKIVFALIFLPILVVALDTLKMKAISEPATAMLGTFLNAIPNILAATIIVATFYFVGTFVVGLLVDFLRNMGTDDIAQKMGISRVIGHRSLADVIGKIALFFLIFTGIITGAEQLGMTALNDILATIFQIAGRVFFGVIILAAGSYVANLIGEMVKKSESNWMAPIAKFAVIGIFLAFALHTMGIAESIVNLAFGLTLGAAATAFALAFGLGGREVAGRQLEQFFDKSTTKDNLKVVNRNKRMEQETVGSLQ